MKCPYCDQEATKITSRELFNVDVEDDREYFACIPCNARVRIKYGAIPVGTMANAELRAERQRFSVLFDKAWISGTGEQREGTRKAAYKWLSNRLGISYSQCAVNRMDLDLLRRATAIVVDAKRTGDLLRNAMVQNDRYDHVGDHGKDGAD